jgi:hypothetical protein
LDACPSDEAPEETEETELFAFVALADGGALSNEIWPILPNLRAGGARADIIASYSISALRVSEL